MSSLFFVMKLIHYVVKEMWRGKKTSTDNKNTDTHQQHSQSGYGFFWKIAKFLEDSEFWTHFCFESSKGIFLNSLYIYYLVTIWWNSYISAQNKDIHSNLRAPAYGITKN